MSAPPPIEVYSDRDQCMMILLAVLADLRSTKSKQEVLYHIEHHHYFDIQPDDLKPYQTQSEPKWHTMIAWARKDCVLRGFMFEHDERDLWEIARPGILVFEKCRSRFGDGTLDVRRCYLWTPTFKKQMCPTYAPSDRDAKRPTRYPGLHDLLDELL